MSSDYNAMVDVLDKFLQSTDETEDKVTDFKYIIAEFIEWLLLRDKLNYIIEEVHSIMKFHHPKRLNGPTANSDDRNKYGLVDIDSLMTVLEKADRYLEARECISATKCYRSWQDILQNRKAINLIFGDNAKIMLEANEEIMSKAFVAAIEKNPYENALLEKMQQDVGVLKIADYFIESLLKEMKTVTQKS